MITCLKQNQKKELHDQGSAGDTNPEGKEGLSYVQNAEQSDDSIWSRIQSRIGIKPKDELYKLYDETKFADLVVNPETDSELHRLIEETKARGPKFSNYPPEQIEHFVRRIYELRKDQPNNPTRQVV